MYIELLRRLGEERRRELARLWDVLEEVKRIIRGLDPEARVYVFGSYARGNQRPDSDVDVLVVTKLAASEEGRIAVRRALTSLLSPYTPIELHVATPEQFRWYLQFIDAMVEV